jgi:DNA-binding transcriptional LysR family regulator
MEWQQIVGFFHTARLGSFTKAGEATLRTQSALSQQIRALEAEFGCQFFERVGTRKLKLTAAGERFLRFSESVLKGREDLVADLNELTSCPRGPLRIAAPFTTLYHLFPGKLVAYVDRFPEVEVTLLDRPQGSVVDLVRDGDVDFGVAVASVVPADLAWIRWKVIETVLLVPEGHPLTRVRRVTWRRLARYPIILPPKDHKYAGRVAFEEEMQKLGLDCRVVMESSNVELSALYVEAGMGVAPASIVRELPLPGRRRVALLSLSHYFEPDHLVLVMRKDQVAASYKTAFVNLLLEEAPGES